MGMNLTSRNQIACILSLFLTISGLVPKDETKVETNYCDSSRKQIEYLL